MHAAARVPRALAFSASSVFGRIRSLPVQRIGQTCKLHRVASISATSSRTSEMTYPIGEPGVPWTSEEKKQWRASVETPVRSYNDEVITKIDSLRKNFDVQMYGALPYDDENTERYPLFVVFSKNWDETKPSVLITGGVHGYETSGVQGALEFLKSKALEYSNTFNMACAPCVSPWGYERIQRWNAEAVDPNRSFDKQNVFGKGETPPAYESAALMRMLRTLGVEEWLVHIDLHETTDRDESEFRPAKAARDGETCEPDVIPDGFYCVADSNTPQPGFQKAIVDSVRSLTHIAPPDTNGNIIGEPIKQEGVIEYPLDDLFLCASMTGAKYTSTSEVYPDSPTASPEECNQAQVACVVGGLDFVVKEEGLVSR